jgi:hypothetical protein
MIEAAKRHEETQNSLLVLWFIVRPGWILYRG